MIKEEICSKEICLLVEQNLGGTPLDNVGYYDGNGNIHKWNEIDFSGVCQAFSQSVVMRWLREEKHICIEPYCIDQKFMCGFAKLPECVNIECHQSYGEYATYEEAIEAAVKYVLENLI